MENLFSEMRRALNLMRAAGIEGWGLSNPNPDLFNLVEVGGSVGCTSETCNHWSHDPAAPVNKLVPRDGWAISLLGSCGADGASGYVEFYVTWRGEVARIWRLDAPDPILGHSGRDPGERVARLGVCEPGGSVGVTDEKRFDAN